MQWSFTLRISSVNVIKSAFTYGFGPIYWRNPGWKNFIICAVKLLVSSDWNGTKQQLPLKWDWSPQPHSHSSHLKLNKFCLLRRSGNYRLKICSNTSTCQNKYKWLLVTSFDWHCFSWLSIMKNFCQGFCLNL